MGQRHREPAWTEDQRQTAVPASRRPRPRRSSRTRTCRGRRRRRGPGSGRPARSARTPGRRRRSAHTRTRASPGPACRGRSARGSRRRRSPARPGAYRSSARRFRGAPAGAAPPSSTRRTRRRPSATSAGSRGGPSRRSTPARTTAGGRRRLERDQREAGEDLVAGVADVFEGVAEQPGQAAAVRVEVRERDVLGDPGIVEAQAGHVVVDGLVPGDDAPGDEMRNGRPADRLGHRRQREHRVRSDRIGLVDLAHPVALAEQDTATPGVPKWSISAPTKLSILSSTASTDALVTMRPFW